MKILAWYGTAMMGWFQLTYLNELLFGTDKSTYFWIFIVFVPICVFYVKYLINTYKRR